jgi:putative sugar O-methyltransferase
MWEIDTNTKQNYLDVCLQASQDLSVFNNFKSNRSYNHILEHVEQNHGQEYFNIINKNYPELLDYFDKFITNDEVGNPAVFKYDRWFISPTTLRYIKVLGDLKLYFGSLNNLDIIEIGCGYGGQCKIIHDLFKPKSYTLLDLLEPSLLQQKYLEHYQITAKFFIPDKLEYAVYNLVISNYAFNELDNSTMEFYKNNVIDYSSSGYFTIINNPRVFKYFPKGTIIPQNDLSYTGEHNIFIFKR